MITGANISDIVQFKKEMAEAFKMSDLGLLHYYLGIEVRQGPGGSIKELMPPRFW
uniref:Reverse transcriptase Ty1/copia-type domain-containing protein n=1 Tax=Arundo donax TaxID=35708 RepID=A0A0A8ZIU4_ARUDO